MHSTIYHIVVLDIRMDEMNPNNDGSKMDGIALLRELNMQGLSEVTKVIMLSAHGTAELMRQTFRDYKIVDFLSKDEFNNKEFLELVRKVFAQDVKLNQELEIHWQDGMRLDDFVVNLEVGGKRIQHSDDRQGLIAAELDDLLCRLFFRAESILVSPLTPGFSGAGVLRVQPFFTAGGGGHEVIVKFGDSSRIEQEHSHFKEYVQPFLGGGRTTTIVDVRYTFRLGGIIYSLVGAAHDPVVDFADFYRSRDISQIIKALDGLFRHTCGNWYASRGNLRLLNLSAEYEQWSHFSIERLEQVIAEQLKSVEGKQALHFKNLKSDRDFTNPLHAIARQTLVRPTYSCTTHGDCNVHNLLVDTTGHIWLIDFQGTGQSHILRDVATLDAVIRFQLLGTNEASPEERLHMEEALDSIKHFSEVKQLPNAFSTQNAALAKVYATVVHLRTIARNLVAQNPADDINEYYIALLYAALNTLRFPSVPEGQREYALLSASLLADRIGLRA
ncbi:MAG TPA: phosphotransferase [Ktedonobacteraceae bacterium]|nr:phosphotransferase [Ktedonobacteraceae bacterium]